ncbi:biotin--[acetyl-CoA-carboxylase] ligase [Peptoniphilus sp. GNH]|nr:biotin--[acetyl-CoA-carboxylase] ligase [Clostridiales bacterium KA00134]UHR03553.1 biotin--[acetyl-CoA-carboxylase] ligase [Peptoniphilus sp. GNH]
MQALNECEIRKFLCEDLKNIKINIFDEITSTNDFLKKEILSRDNLEVCLADFQTKGRGRFGRTFESPRGRGIYMSLVLKDTFIDIDSILTLRIGLAVYEALKAYSDNLKLKWVNDIYLNEKKLGGILIEGVYNPFKQKIDRLVAGIGINVLAADMPIELRDKVSFLNTKTSRNELIASILNEIFTIRNKTSEYVVENFEKLNLLKGRYISYMVEGREAFGKVLGISKDGFLELEVGNEKILLNSGEVSIKSLDKE